MKRLCILGSTGSIGTQSLDVVRMSQDIDELRYQVDSLTANKNTDIIEQQAREFKPRMVAMLDEKSANDLKIRLGDTDIKVYSGVEGICECAEADSLDTVINAIVGLAGLKPTLSALSAGKTLALANKETLVAGGHLVTDLAKKNNVPILPVDSEHSAIFQCLQAAPPNKALKKIILTASGGPFFGKTREELKSVTVEQALKHPNWDMGAKITIDSATMFNKGLELIEAVRLFDVTEDMINIIVHRESIVHSMIEFDDNSILAQMGVPDMRIPIQYALTYPNRYPSPVEELDFRKHSNLSFFEPDYEAFDCLGICRKAIKMGGLYPAAVNSANEVANYKFQKGEISFLKIGEKIRKAFDIAPNISDFTADDIFALDEEIRRLI
jgi:1-deoxy-D-xylulose-5-phosphate reductoisomerase